jgi:uncharacterized protein with von Willebrand factor type A (vWA) domain
MMTPDTPLARGADEILLGFARALRAAGVPVTADRTHAFVAAAALLGADDPRNTYLAGRATMCAGPQELQRYEQVFAAYFNGRDGLPRPRQTPSALRAAVELADAEDDSGSDDSADDGADDRQDATRAKASDVEVLRHRDVAALSPADKARLAAQFTTITLHPPLRRVARRHAWHRGAVDAERTLRASLRTMGEPARIAWRRREYRARRIVLLIDVSGSMSGYADALLRLAHRFTHAAAEGAGTRRQAGVETFTVGTRLTRLTRAMQLADPERALVAAGQAVPDWSGGTRLGETLQVFLDRFGRHGMARGAVVVICSDGWERGDTALLAQQAAALGRVARSVIWLNPHRGKAGYAPVQSGIVAVLPHVDHFVAGHSLAAFAELTEVIADA